MTGSSMKLFFAVSVALMCACVDLKYHDVPTEFQKNCGMDNAKVGQVAHLTNRFVHGVSGTARVVDNCTIVVEHFYYDGIAADSRFILLKDYDWSNYIILTDSMMRNEGFQDETITLPLPAGTNLDNINMISLCCLPGLDYLGNGNLGEGVFQAP